MDTPKKALNVARMAAWTSFGLAAGLSVTVMKWINLGGAAMILVARPAAIATVELAAALVFGALAYVRPAAWSIALVVALLVLDAANTLFTHGFNLNLVIDLAFAFLAALSFQGARRYAELRGEAPKEDLSAAFD